MLEGKVIFCIKNLFFQGWALGTQIWRGKTSSESEARRFSPSKPPPFFGHGLGGSPKNPNFYRFVFLRMLSLTGSEALFLSCQGMSSHGGRVGSAEICFANLRSPEKSMEGFFRGRHGLGAISLNVSRYA